MSGADGSGAGGSGADGRGAGASGTSESGPASAERVRSPGAAEDTTAEAASPDTRGPGEGPDARFEDSYRPAKLAARDGEDLRVFSALLQDAVVLTHEIAWLPPERRFAFVGNRFRWEEPDAGERVRVGVHFEDVARVRARGVDLSAKDQPLVILTVAFEAGPTAPGGVVRIACAGEVEILLEVEALEAVLRDMTGPWRAQRRPRHAGV